MSWNSSSCHSRAAEQYQSQTGVFQHTAFISIRVMCVRLTFVPFYCPCIKITLSVSAGSFFNYSTYQDYASGKRLFEKGTWKSTCKWDKWGRWMKLCCLFLMAMHARTSARTHTSFLDCWTLREVDCLFWQKTILQWCASVVIHL